MKALAHHYPTTVPIAYGVARANRNRPPAPAAAAAIENSVLAALPRKDYALLAAKLEKVTLIFGDVLYDPGDTIRHVYFPNNALISLLTVVDAHLALEVGLVGREGMVGIPLVLGHITSPVRTLVQGTGTALRMASAPFLAALKTSPALQNELQRYTYRLLAQISQTAGCNRFHVVEQRLARWLLMSQDRVKSDHFRMTHEFLGHMLGVRRVGVTRAAQTLHLRKLISYRRGDIVILDRAGLEAAACGCYAVVCDMHEPATARPRPTK